MGSVLYMPIDGELVSAEWHTLLEDLRGDGVAFNVNEGHRTLARQAYFYAEYKAGRGALAAVPSPTAPHIRTGRFDHAIDFNNAQAVITAAGKRGVPCRLTVPGESWHVEADAAALQKYHEAQRWPPSTLRPGGPRSNDVKRLQVLLKRRKYLGRLWKTNTLYGPNVAKAVKKFQKDNHLTADGVVGPKTWDALDGTVTHG